MGFKSLSTLSILLLLIVGNFYAGNFHVEYLNSLGPNVLFVVGCLGAVFSALFFRFWKLHTLSHFGLFAVRKEDCIPQDSILFHVGPYHLVIRPTRLRTAWEFKAANHKLLFLCLCLLAMLQTMDNRGLEGLVNLSGQIFTDSTKYCPDAENPIVNENDPTLVGCRLVIRAFNLGYAKTLGDCAPKEAKVTENFCEYRQKDEPLFHYSWRLAKANIEALSLKNQKAGPLDTYRKIREQFPQWRSLKDYQLALVSSEPKSAHFIWTNLPNPHGWRGGGLDKFLEPSACLSEFQDLPHRLRPAVQDKSIADSDRNSAAQSFEHSVAQLLFNAKYNRSAGNCREYKIFWNSSIDTCANIQKDPERELARIGIANTVNSVVDRIRLISANAKIFPGNAYLSAKVQDQATLSTNYATSFSCYFVDTADSTSAHVREFLFKGTQFKVVETRIAAADSQSKVSQTKDFKNVARLLSKTFRYSGFESFDKSHFSLAKLSEADLFSGPLMLSRLDMLLDTDLFMEYSWLDERQDLLEIYPYYHHLYHFIGLFRDEYAKMKGRL